VTGRDIVDPQRTEICCYMHARSKRGMQSSLASAKAKNRPTQDDNADENLHSDSEPVSGNSKLPPFSYSIEIQRIGTMIEGQKNVTRVRQFQDAFLAGRFFHHRESHERVHAPIHYMIVVHPPIILENLLPMGGLFEIVHATQHKRVLWSSWIDPGIDRPWMINQVVN